MNEQKLVQEANKARQYCYVPYSQFKVGAAVLLKDGTVIHGANIENASYGLSMCAERNALIHTRLKGYQKEDIVALAVIADSNIPVSPCGACRQVMSELMPAQTPVYLSSQQFVIKETTVSELLPFAFDGTELPKK
jgi:cytidine deaminase